MRQGRVSRALTVSSYKQAVADTVDIESMSKFHVLTQSKTNQEQCLTVEDAVDILYGVTKAEAVQAGTYDLEICF